MSGIAGIVHFDGAPVEPGAMEKMTGVMAPRGPDGIRHWVKGSVGLGQCMLSTTPEAIEERQPLTNEDDSLALVLDGRVDNLEELRRELLGRGAVLRDRSDAELVLRAYEAWGEECPDRIIGEFVFFVWDARRRLFFGARDAAGTRHFYYHASDRWFGFASEIKGLLATERITPRLNESRLLDYLVNEYDRDDEVGTFYQGIHRLPAGHAMRATQQGAVTWRYWNPANLPEAHPGSLDDFAEGLLEQLRVAVKCRLRSNGPVGAMLSGGLDSSSIVGLIRKEFRDDLRQPLKTFSLIREDRENCRDWRSIEKMLEDGWIEPTILSSAVAGDVCRDYLDAIPDLNEPFALSQGFNDSLVYEAARKEGCRVVLDGMAGDLLFYSFDRSLVFSSETIAHIPAILMAFRRHGVKLPLRRLAWRALAVATPDALRAVYRKARSKYGVLGRDVRLMRTETARRFLEAKHSQRKLALDTLKGCDDRAAHARFFTSGLLSFAHEVNGQTALSRGVEPRSPFSDRRMIEFAVQMPKHAKLSARWYKHVLRKSMAGILPEDVRWRRDVGMHPGEKFHGRFISEMSRCAPEIWDRVRLERKLGKWVDAATLRRAWDKYDSSADYSAGFSLFMLAVLAQWIGARFDGIQPD